MRVTRRRIPPRAALVAGSMICATSLVLTGCGSKATNTDAAQTDSCVDTAGSKIKVGSLNSLSGTMAISEVTVRDAIRLAVEQINSSGGVLGKQIELVGEDGASEPTAVSSGGSNGVGEELGEDFSWGAES